jgi:hypothetical protein
MRKHFCFQERAVTQTEPQSGSLKEKVQKEFNTALMERITEVCKKILKNDKPSLLDIVRYHVGERLPIYFTTGELASQ